MLTATHAGEPIGVVRAAVTADVPVVVAFTVETDGRLPSGQPLHEAVKEVDAATGGAALHFEELGALYSDLVRSHPHLKVLGGCCGTDPRHVEAIARACLRSAT